MRRPGASDLGEEDSDAVLLDIFRHVMEEHKSMIGTRRIWLARVGGRFGACAMIAASLPAASPCAAQDLNKDVTAAIAKAHLGASTVGISIIDVQTGAALAAINQDERFSPASNMKLLTTGTALAMLGPDYEFRTRLQRHGARIVIEGAADPAFADHVLLAEMHTGLNAFVERLAKAVVDSGMTTVSEVIVDDRVLDRDYIHPEWPRDQLDSWYCAEVSGLNFHANVLCAFASPGAREGDAAIIRTEPAGSAVEIVTRAKTVHAGNTSFWAAREALENKFTIFGTVRAAPVEPIEVTMHEPSVVFARLLADRLAQLGLGPLARARAASDPPGEPTAPAPCRLAATDEELGTPDESLAVVRTPISVILRRCNVDSHNLYAESLIKLLGHVSTGQPGTWSGGGAVVRMQVRQLLGPEAAATIFITDGSGLSRSNKVTPAVLARWLAAISQDERFGAAFVQSLPRAKLDGTMAKRFESKTLLNEVRGKSGLINGVRCLSGYVTNRESGHRLAYSILVNDIPAGVPGPRVKEFHEDVVEIADKWLARRCKVQEKEAVGG